MSTNINDEGNFTLEEIEDLLVKVDAWAPSTTISQDQIDLILEALVFYKEMNYI